MVDCPFTKAGHILSNTNNFYGHLLFLLVRHELVGGQKLIIWWSCKY